MVGPLRAILFCVAFLPGFRFLKRNVSLYKTRQASNGYPSARLHRCYQYFLRMKSADMWPWKLLRPGTSKQIDQEP